MATNRINPEDFSTFFKKRLAIAEQGVRAQVVARGYRASNEISNQTQLVLSGQRHGRIYRTGRRRHVASAPGEAPAVQTGNLRLSFGRSVTVVKDMGRNVVVEASAQSNVKYAHALDSGRRDGHFAPRPYRSRALERALPRVKKIYREPY